MTLYAKPNMSGGVWADRGETIAPSDLKIARGWVVEIPPHQQFNWWMRRADAMAVHINQRGVVQWDTTVQYYNNLSYVQGPTNGIIYRAIQDSMGRNPESSPTFWEVAFMRRGDAYTKVEIDAFRNTDRGYVDATFLKIASNLSDVPNKGAARSNLQVYSTAETDAKYMFQVNAYTKTQIDGFRTADKNYADTTFTRKDNNLSDLTNLATARNNLNVYSRTEGDARYLRIANNLSDVPNVASARTTLQVYSKAETDNMYAKRASNLSDLLDRVAARNNLGLGDAAVRNVGQGAGQVAAGDDPRIVNAVPNYRGIVAGLGLFGGGTLDNNVVIDLGVPSTVSLTTGNTRQGSTHTHALSLDMTQFFPNRWVNMTGARANGGTYWNTSGKMMFVAVTSGATVHQASLQMLVNGEIIVQTEADMINGVVGGMVFVPAGASYSCTANTGIIRWMETQ